MKEKRSGIPVPVLNRKKEDTEEKDGRCDDESNQTTTTTKLPTPPAVGPKLCGSARRKAVARRKTASVERERRKTSPTHTKPISIDTGKIKNNYATANIAPNVTTNAGTVKTSSRHPVARKLSMGALQQERVDLVMGREELAKEWLDNEQEKQRLEIKLLHINLNMTTVENEIREMTSRENELRCEVKRR